MDQYENNTGYFENRSCSYYPCHDAEHINCLFCYCPMYPYDDCPGNPSYIEKENVRIKNCTDCLFVHTRENYAKVIRFLSERMHKGELPAILHKYRFYGWETADVSPVEKIYQGIRDPRMLYDLLCTCWCAETCAPRMRKLWSDENRTLGQCSITAFLAQDIFGGKVYGVPLKDGNVHCYNVVGNTTFDLTSEQFGEEKLDYTDNPEQFREIHFQKKEKKARYELLKKSLRIRIDE